MQQVSWMMKILVIMIGIMILYWKRYNTIALMLYFVSIGFGIAGYYMLILKRQLKPMKQVVFEPEQENTPEKDDNEEKTKSKDEILLKKNNSIDKETNLEVNNDTTIETESKFVLKSILKRKTNRDVFITSTQVATIRDAQGNIHRKQQKFRQLIKCPSSENERIIAQFGGVAVENIPLQNEMESIQKEMTFWRWIWNVVNDFVPLNIQYWINETFQAIFTAFLFTCCGFALHHALAYDGSYDLCGSFLKHLLGAIGFEDQIEFIQNL